jgi:hypothetical protein
MIPDWSGASEIYSKLYAILAVMAKTDVIVYTGRKKRPTGCQPSERMLAITKALDSGNEETLKGFALEYNHLLLSPRN